MNRQLYDNYGVAEGESAQQTHCERQLKSMDSELVQMAAAFGQILSSLKLSSTSRTASTVM